MPILSEAEVEAILLHQLQGLGCACLNDVVSSHNGSAPEREAYSETILPRLVSRKVRVSEVECAAAEVA